MQHAPQEPCNLQQYLVLSFQYVSHLFRCSVVVQMSDSDVRVLVVFYVKVHGKLAAINDGDARVDNSRLGSTPQTGIQLPRSWAGNSEALLYTRLLPVAYLRGCLIPGTAPWHLWTAVRRIKVHHSSAVLLPVRVMYDDGYVPIACHLEQHTHATTTARTQLRTPKHSHQAL